MHIDKKFTNFPLKQAIAWNMDLVDIILIVLSAVHVCLKIAVFSWKISSLATIFKILCMWIKFIKFPFYQDIACDMDLCSCRVMVG